MITLCKKIHFLPEHTNLLFIQNLNTISLGGENKYWICNDQMEFQIYCVQVEQAMPGCSSDLVHILLPYL